MKISTTSLAVLLVLAGCVKPYGRGDAASAGFSKILGDYWLYRDPAGIEWVRTDCASRSAAV